jgi:Na+/melibiose symporter-like transporter
MTAADEHPNLRLKLGYGLGSVADGAMAGLGGLVLFFYNQVVGVPAAIVSLALAVMTLSDAFFDVLIGFASDRTRSRFGRRHLFIYASMLLTPIGLYVRWHPPHHWPDAWMFWYVLLGGMFMNISFALYTVPAGALAPELAPGYHDRTVLLSYRWTLGALSTALATILTYGVFLRPTREHPIGQLNGAGYGPLSLAVTVIVVAGMLALAIGTHGRIRRLHKPPPSRRAELRAGLRDVWITLSNWNFAVAILAGVVAGLGTGLETGLRLYFATYFWNLNSGDLLILTLVTIPAPIFAGLVGSRLSARWGKKRACMSLFFASVLVGNLPMLLKLIGVLRLGASPQLLAILSAAYFSAVILGVGGFVIVSAMIADIVEDVQVKTGRRSEGLLFTADLLPTRIVGSISTLFPGLLLAWVAFPVHARPGPLALALMTRVAWVYLPATVLISLVSISIWSLYRIDQTSHERNLERLRALREDAASPAQ